LQRGDNAFSTDADESQSLFVSPTAAEWGFNVQVFFGIAYFVVGIVQLFAIADGVNFGLGIGSFFSFIIAAFLTYIPVLGSLAGLYGAVNAWDWSIWQALALFFWYIPVVLLVGGISAVVGR